MNPNDPDFNRQLVRDMKESGREILVSLWKIVVFFLILAAAFVVGVFVHPIAGLVLAGVGIVVWCLKTEWSFFL